MIKDCQDCNSRHSREIASTTSDLSLALRNVLTVFESMDLITSNGLKLRSNNQKSPVRSVTVTGISIEICDENCTFVVRGLASSSSNERYQNMGYDSVSKEFFKRVLVLHIPFLNTFQNGMMLVLQVNKMSLFKE